MLSSLSFVSNETSSYTPESRNSAFIGRHARRFVNDVFLSWPLNKPVPVFTAGSDVLRTRFGPLLGSWNLVWRLLNFGNVLRRLFRRLDLKERCFTSSLGFITASKIRKDLSYFYWFWLVQFDQWAMGMLHSLQNLSYVTLQQWRASCSLTPLAALRHLVLPKFPNLPCFNNSSTELSTRRRYSLFRLITIVRCSGITLFADSINLWKDRKVCC